MILAFRFFWLLSRRLVRTPAIPGRISVAPENGFFSMVFATVSHLTRLLIVLFWST